MYYKEMYRLKSNEEITKAFDKEVKSFMVDGAHKADISHNKDKSEWFITVKKEEADLQELRFNIVRVTMEMRKLQTEHKFYAVELAELQKKHKDLTGKILNIL